LPPSPSAAPPTPTAAPTVPAGPVLRQLDRAELQLLIRQGEQFVAAGDMVTARVVFQRAAETGDAGAAMALAATYDPLVLAKLGVLGVGADVDKARNWYLKAKEFGSQEAPRRLELLANR
jgi:TPR repeat protein